MYRYVVKGVVDQTVIGHVITAPHPDIAKEKFLKAHPKTVAFTQVKVMQSKNRGKGHGRY